MRHTFTRDGIPQGLDHMILPDDFSPLLGPPFTIKSLRQRLCLQSRRFSQFLLQVQQRTLKDL